MNDHLQLDITEPIRGVLMLAFPGRAIGSDADHFIEAIESELRQRRIRKLIFDLSAADPINNPVGRVWDFARGYSRHRHMQVEFRIPRNVYADLQSTEHESLPINPKRKARLEGVQFVITTAIKQSAFFQRQAAAIEASIRSRKPELAITSGKSLPASSAPAEREKIQTAITCDGKVRAINQDQVRVSLFTKNGEVVGNLLKKQFPSPNLKVGQVFRYNATISSPGTTEIEIYEIPERIVSSDEIIDFWKEVNTQLPSEEF